MKSGFGKPGTDGMPPPGPRPKPHKRPTQARAKFTVEAIYQAFVRIWMRDGWQRLTTREVALEAGFAVGTLYDYFPSKEALLSGYIPTASICCCSVWTAKWCTPRGWTGAPGCSVWCGSVALRSLRHSCSI